jgi:hypothetical protein
MFLLSELLKYVSLCREGDPLFDAKDEPPSPIVLTRVV